MDPREEYEALGRRMIMPATEYAERYDPKWVKDIFELSVRRAALEL